MSSFELKELKDLSIEIIDGDRGVHYPPKTEFASSGFCLFLNTGNVTTSGFDFSSLDFIDEKRDSLLKKGKLKLFDIVLTTRGTVGNVGFFDKTIPYENIRINSGMVILRTDRNKIAPYYLYSFLKSDLFKKQVKTQGSGSAQPQLPISSLKNISLPLVELKTQQRIASVLSALDSKIELNNRINAELEAMAKTLYDYWFVQFDFPDQHGNPYKSSGGKMVWNDELKREIPSGWEVKRLDAFSKIIRGVTYNKDQILKPNDKNSIPILRATNISNNEIDLNDMVYVPANLVSEDQKLQKFDVVIAMSSGSKAHIGKNAFFYFDKEISFGAFCSKLLIHKNYRFYIFTHLQSVEFKKYIANVCLGTNINNLNNELISGYRLLTPCNKQLMNFEEIIEGFYNKIANNLIENLQLADLRDWLLPMLMNGQVKVENSSLEE